MLAATAGLTQLRPYYTDETRDLFGVLLNALSAAEANLALDVLRQTVPDRALITACNVREILRTLPSSPFSMRVDEATLASTAGLERDIAVLRKFLPDGTELAVTTAGNLVLDLIVKTDRDKFFWSPVPVTHEYVNATTIDLIMSCEGLLDEVIDLVKCMGLVFNPKFYLSLEDFHLEYAAETIDDLGELF